MTHLPEYPTLIVFRLHNKDAKPRDHDVINLGSSVFGWKHCVADDPVYVGVKIESQHIIHEIFAHLSLGRPGLSGLLTLFPLFALRLGRGSENQYQEYNNE